MDTREIVTRMYAAAAAGDIPTLREALSPDFVATEPNFLPYGGVYNGVDGFVALFAEVSKVIDLSQLVLDGLTVEDDMAYARVRVPLVSGGGTADILEEWQVRDGRVVSGRVFWLQDPTQRSFT